MDFFKSYSVGDKVCSPCADSIQFELADGGGVLLIKLSRPTAKEKRSFKEITRFRFIVVEDIIMVMVRFGTSPWMDAPYYKYLSHNLAHTEFPEDNEGLAIHVLLIDASTGVLVAQKLFSPDTDTSRAFLTAVQLQPEIPDFRSRITSVMAQYTTQKLIDIWEAQNNARK